MMANYLIDGWEVSYNSLGKNWNANYITRIDNNKASGYLVYMLDELMIVEEYGSNKCKAFVSIPMKVIHKLLELK